jgi:hypothetical protein
VSVWDVELDCTASQTTFRGGRNDYLSHSEISRVLLFRLFLLFSLFSNASTRTRAASGQMMHASKRLASAATRLTSVSATSLPKFPPKEALYLKKAVPETPFDVDAWAELQPPPTSALSALAHRVGLGSTLTPEQVLQSCTHSSFVSFHQFHRPKDPAPTANTQLSSIGNGLMGLFASEFISATYPYLPTRVLKAAVTAYVGPYTCASVAQEIGATPLLRWRRSVRLISRVFLRAFLLTQVAGT